MPIDERSSLEDVCFAICTALDESGTVAVLVGGSAASIYAPEAYQSRDADFIATIYGADGAVVMSRLGFTEKGGTYWHATSAFTVEFVPRPIFIGDEVIDRWETLRRGSEVLHIVTRVDCIRDRLLWFYHYGDRSALAAAIGVAKSGNVDMEFLREWSAREGKGAAFDEFLSRVNST